MTDTQWFCGNAINTTRIVFERRGEREDHSLRDTFQRICRGRNACGPPMPGFIPVFASKQSHATGLPLADLTARPIGAHFLRPNQPNKAHDVIRTKLRRDRKGREKGWGVKWFPDPLYKTKGFSGSTEALCRPGTPNPYVRLYAKRSGYQIGKAHFGSSLTRDACIPSRASGGIGLLNPFGTAWRTSVHALTCA